MITKLLIFILSSTLFISCGQQGNETDSLRTKISVLEARIDSLEKKIQSLSEKQRPTVSKKKNPTTSNKSIGPESLVLTENKDEPTIDNNSQAVSQQAATYQKPASNSGSSHQCMGTTKKGARCKRMVSNGNYCWQHGG